MNRDVHEGDFPVMGNEGATEHDATGHSAPRSPSGEHIQW